MKLPARRKKSKELIINAAAKQGSVSDATGDPNKLALSKRIKKIWKKKWVKAIVIILIIVLLVNSCVAYMGQKVTDAFNQMGGTAIVTRGDIEVSISSSGTVEPIETYNITAPNLNGKVISADFEEGDQVQKDQVLYLIDTESVDTKVEDSNLNIERAQRKYDLALKNYQKSLQSYDDLSVKANAEGQIVEMSVEVGDTVALGSVVAKILNSNTMVLKVPFNSGDVNDSLLGLAASIQMEDTMEQLTGVVSEINQLEQVLDGGRLVKYVSIELNNPGGIVSGMTATASIGQLFCNDIGTFGPAKERNVTAKATGEIVSVSAKEGDRVVPGQVLCSIDSESVDTSVENYLSTMDAAADVLEDAKKALEDTQDSRKDYEITAPISGQIITKTVKAGEKLNSIAATTLAVVYDLSAYKFKMMVDELDIKKISIGQQVTVTADALEGIEMSGIVENISLASVSSSGITQYPVTVRMDETGELLPGMSVTSKVITNSVKDVLVIPAEALIQGDKVYVADPSVKESINGIPAGYKMATVVVGAVGNDNIEIISGLNEGETLYIDRKSVSLQDMMMQQQQGVSVTAIGP